MQVNIILIIIIVILSSILAIIITNGKSSHCGDYPLFHTMLFSHLQKSVEIGDLVLFASSRCDTINRNLGNPYFSHVGIIVNDHEKGLCCLEYTVNSFIYPNQKQHLGSMITPINQRFGNYSGRIFFCKRKFDLSDKQKNIINEYYKDYSPPFFTFCSRYIAHVFSHIGIQGIDTWQIWKIHNNIINMAMNETHYSFPIEIIHDDALINNISDAHKGNYCLGAVPAPKTPQRGFR